MYHFYSKEIFFKTRAIICSLFSEINYEYFKTFMDRTVKLSPQNIQICFKGKKLLFRGEKNSKGNIASWQLSPVLQLHGKNSTKLLIIKFMLPEDVHSKTK